MNHSRRNLFRSVETRKKTRPLALACLVVILPLLAVLLLQNVKNDRKNESRFTTSQKQFFEIASVIARPLESYDKTKTTKTKTKTTQTQSIIDKIVQAELISQKGGNFKDIADDYSTALRRIMDHIQDSPRIKDVARSGRVLIKEGRKNEDEITFQFLGSLASAAYLSNKIDNYMNDLEREHKQIINLRNKLAVAMQKSNSPTASTRVARAFFYQTGVRGRLFKNDALGLKNISGQDLHNVIVTVRLIGKNDKFFDNLYYANEWKSGETLLAYCQSDRPFRETVSQVSRVRYQVFADEVVGKPQVLTGNPILHMEPSDYGVPGG